MSVVEEAVVFDCAGETLVGVVTRPGRPAATGVLIVVGGPQYRAGSHRQFVLLARFLAARGVACMRFDYRGMGDATGEARDFHAVDEDIGAALAAFFARVPQLRSAVLWGLCDGASAACFHAPNDPRVAGLVLVNPWVRTDAGEAQVYLKHYYTRRLADPAFWKKLLRGGVNIAASLRSLATLTGRAAAAGTGSPRAAAEADLCSRMAASLARCDIPFAVFLSGNDYVAREFEQEAKRHVQWCTLMDGPRGQSLAFPAADHTFSSAVRRDEVAAATWNWMRRTLVGEFTAPVD